MAADHVALVRGLERDGPAVLREHLWRVGGGAGRRREGDSERAGRVGGPPAR